jgi:hypothetical protein
VHAKFPSLVVACGKNAAPIARAAHSNRLAFQLGAIPHLDCRVKAIHVEMDDPARGLLVHELNLPQSIDSFHHGAVAT